MASIWHVGAHAAPNLSSDDWLQDWKVLGAGQDSSAGKGRVRSGLGEAEGTAGSHRPASGSVRTQEYLPLPWAAQPPVDAVAVRREVRELLVDRASPPPGPPSPVEPHQMTPLTMVDWSARTNLLLSSRQGHCALRTHSALWFR